MTEYVLGFMFSEDFEQVALIRKNRPEWQAGLLNGIGGHIEPEELPHDAMVREFKEEAGVDITSWVPYAKMIAEGRFAVYVFYCSGNLNKLKTMTDEPIVNIWVSELCMETTVESLPWLIPLALDCIEDGRPEWTEIRYPQLSRVNKGGKMKDKDCRNKSTLQIKDKGKVCKCEPLSNYYKDTNKCCTCGKKIKED